MYDNTIADQMFDTYPQQKELGNLLRKSREVNNLDIYKMAEILKVSPSRLKQIENGDFSIMHEIYTKSIVTRYANYTNVKIEKLFKQIWDNQESQNSNDNIRAAYLNIASMFSKNTVEIDKSGNHMYMFLGGICAVALGIFFLKTYTKIDYNKEQNIISASETSNKNMNSNKISVLKLDKELNSYKAKTLNAENKDIYLSKSLVAKNDIVSKPDDKLKNNMIDENFTKNSGLMPVAYIIKQND